MLVARSCMRVRYGGSEGNRDGMTERVEKNRDGEYSNRFLSFRRCSFSGNVYHYASLISVSVLSIPCDVLIFFSSFCLFVFLFFFFFYTVAAVSSCSLRE